MPAGFLPDYTPPGSSAIPGNKPIAGKGGVARRSTTQAPKPMKGKPFGKKPMSRSMKGRR